MVSIFVLLLIALGVIGVLKTASVLHRTYFYWKGKGLPYLPNSLVTIWKLFLGYVSFADYSQYMYRYFPNAKYVGMMDFSTPAILLRDPELIKDVMVKDFEHFPDHRVFVDESVEPLLGKNVFSLRGDRWREMRNTLSPCFTASKMKFMFGLISRCSRDFVDYLADHPELCRAAETKGIFRRYTNDVIATAAFGISVDSMKDRDNEFYARGTRVTRFSSGLLPAAKVLLLRACPWLARSMGLTFFAPGTSEFFKRVVGETVEVRQRRDIVRPDMIHLLMQARDRDGAAARMTLDDIVAQAFIFFLAGFDTTSTLMCFAAHELAVNRDVQDRLREEVRRHLDAGDGEVSYESLSKMPYMDMVISETLRKYPPVILVDRLCAKRYELPPAQPGCKNVVVEPDNVLMLPVYALHRDPKYFPNPDRFDPERFSEESRDDILPYTYLPFGHGPRKCIGNRFALMETKILIAHLLQKFTLKTVEKTVEPVVYSKKEFTLQPAGGFWIGLEKRET